MIYCPKCNNELADGAKFCNKCGSKIEAEVPASEAAPAPQSAPVSTAAPAAAEAPKTTPMNTGYNPVPETNAADSTAKKGSKKFLLIGGAVVAVAAIAAVAIALIAANTGGKKSKNCALYIRDDQLVFSNLKSDPVELSDDLYDGTLYAESAAYSLGNFVYISGTSNLAIYPDKTDYDSCTLYYVKGISEESEPQKLANNVESYYVSKDESLVTYLTTDGTLYQTNFTDKEKIASDVFSYKVSEDGKTVLYIDDDDRLYIKENGADKEKIDSDVTSLQGYSDDLSVIFYMQEDRVYKYTKGGKAEKVASDVYSVVKTYDSGEMYYVISEEHPLSDLVDDDMAAADADLMDPDDLPYPDYDDYDDYDDYWDAYDEYWDQYDALYDEYYEKQKRDYIREELEDYTYETYSLYYFDGNEDVLVTDSFDYSGYDYASASDKAVIVFKASASEIEKVKISTLDYYSYTSYDIKEQALSSSQILQVAVGGTATTIETQEEGFTIEALSDDGKTLFYIDNAEYDEVYDDYWDEYDEEFVGGELFKVTIDSTPGKPESVAQDVYGASIAESGNIVYYDDYNDDEETANIYIDGAEVGEVYMGKAEYCEKTGEILFFMDWDSDDECGTLVRWKDGKAEELVEDVHDAVFTVNGDILYLYDYSTSREKGDLFQYTGGKENKLLDEDVQALISSDTLSDYYKYCYSFDWGYYSYY